MMHKQSTNKVVTLVYSYEVRAGYKLVPVHLEHSVAGELLEGLAAQAASLLAQLPLRLKARRPRDGRVRHDDAVHAILQSTGQYVHSHFWNLK